MTGFRVPRPRPEDTYRYIQIEVDPRTMHNLGDIIKLFLVKSLQQVALFILTRSGTQPSARGITAIHEESNSRVSSAFQQRESLTP